MKKFRTPAEIHAGQNIAKIYETCSDSTEIKLENFTKYVRRQHLKRFLALYEIFKMVLPVKGSIIDCGVYKGFSFMAWAKLSAMLEPENLTRRIYGFDSFKGFPDVGKKDATPVATVSKGDLRSDSYNELEQLIAEYDKDRFLGHIDKAHLIKGNVNRTIPRFIKSHPHLLVSLLFIDLDLYAPTKIALESFLPRMPKGAIVAFDELDNPLWPGETTACIDLFSHHRMRLQRLEWDPYVAFAVVE